MVLFLFLQDGQNPRDVLPGGGNGRSLFQLSGRMLEAQIKKFLPLFGEFGLELFHAEFFQFFCFHTTDQESR